MNDAVRLYHLGDDGSMTTLMYGSLAAALQAAIHEPEEVLDGLYLQTSNDVIAYLDYVEG